MISHPRKSANESWVEFIHRVIKKGIREEFGITISNTAYDPNDIVNSRNYLVYVETTELEGILERLRIMVEAYDSEYGILKNRDISDELKKSILLGARKELELIQAKCGFEIPIGRIERETSQNECAKAEVVIDGRAIVSSYERTRISEEVSLDRGKGSGIGL